jgi:hypothetical protein
MSCVRDCTIILPINLNTAFAARLEHIQIHQHSNITNVSVFKAYNGGIWLSQRRNSAVLCYLTSSVGFGVFDFLV